jgi:hypothetical protein
MMRVMWGLSVRVRVLSWDGVGFVVVFFVVFFVVGFTLLFVYSY